MSAAYRLAARRALALSHEIQGLIALLSMTTDPQDLATLQSAKDTLERERDRVRATLSQLH